MKSSTSFTLDTDVSSGSSSPSLLPLPPFLKSCLESILLKVEHLLHEPWTLISQLKKNTSDETQTTSFPLAITTSHATFIILLGGSGYGKTLLLKHLQHSFIHQTNPDVHFTHVSSIEGCQMYSLESNASLNFLKEKYPFVHSSNLESKEINIMMIDDLMQLGSFEIILESRKLFLMNMYNTIRSLSPSSPIVFILTCDVIKDLFLPSDLFPKIIELPILTNYDRQRTFESLLEPLSVEDKSNLCQFLAQNTHGYTLKNMVDLLRHTVLTKFHPSSVSSPKTLHSTDFEKPLQWLQPSLSIPKAYTRSIPFVALNELGGFEDLFNRLKHICMLPTMNPSTVSKLGIQWPSGILLYGASGCGKTYMVRALASMTSLNVVHVKGPELFSKYLGESEQKIRELFQEAQKNRPCLLFFDEMDSIGVKRAWNSDESGSVDDRVLSTVLNEMDGIGSREGVMIIGCTHRPFDMDDALLRPGRLDHLIYFRMPTYQDRLKILQLTFPSTERLLNLAKEMVGCTPADLLFLIRESLSVSTKKSEKDQAMTNPPDLEGFELTWKKYSSFFGQARRQALEAPYLNFQESRKL